MATAAAIGGASCGSVAMLSCETSAVAAVSSSTSRMTMTKGQLDGYGGRLAPLRSISDGMSIADSVGRQLRGRLAGQQLSAAPLDLLVDGTPSSGSGGGGKYQHAVITARCWSSRQDNLNTKTTKTTAMASKRMSHHLQQLQALPVSDSVTPPSPTIAVDEVVSQLRRGLPIAILDSESRESETDLFFAAEFLTQESLRKLRVWAGGELYIAIGQDVAGRFGFPFIGKVLDSPALSGNYPILEGMSKSRGMCQGSCSVGLSLDHRSTRTGAPDNERVITCRRLAELARQAQEESWSVEEAAAKLGEEYHTPGHIFLCIEHEKGLAARHGHSELSVAVARLAGVTPVMVGCVMLTNEGEDFGALPPRSAESLARSKGIPFLNGKDIIALCSSESIQVS